MGRYEILDLNDIKVEYESGYSENCKSSYDFVLYADYIVVDNETDDDAPFGIVSKIVATYGYQGYDSDDTLFIDYENEEILDEDEAKERFDLTDEDIKELYEEVSEANNEYDNIIERTVSLEQEKHYMSND